MNKNQRTTLHTLYVLALAALMGACTSAPSQPAAPMPPTIAQHSTFDLGSYDWNLTAAFDALRPSTDLVGLEEAFRFATGGGSSGAQSEEWRPGEK